MTAALTEVPLKEEGNPPTRRSIRAIPGRGDRVFLGFTRTSALVVLAVKTIWEFQ